MRACLMRQSRLATWALSPTTVVFYPPPSSELRRIFAVGKPSSSTLSVPDSEPRCRGAREGTAVLFFSVSMMLGHGRQWSCPVSTDWVVVQREASLRLVYTNSAPISGFFWPRLPGVADGARMASVHLCSETRTTDTTITVLWLLQKEHSLRQVSLVSLLFCAGVLLTCLIAMSSEDSPFILQPWLSSRLRLPAALPCCTETRHPDPSLLLFRFLHYIAVTVRPSHAVY